jgi:Ca-activated chloride channel family protein
MNSKGLPDTLYLDPVRKYDLVVHTMPNIVKEGVSLVPNRHNIIAIDAPQGNIQLVSKGITNYAELKAIVRQSGECETINAQAVNTSKKYLVGKYDLEILTVPRTYLKGVNVNQNETNIFEILQPGKLQITRTRDYIAAIYRIQNGRVEWVCDINDKQTLQVIIMQPGKYFVIGRFKPETRTIYSFEKEFVIMSGSVSELIL